MNSEFQCALLKFFSEVLDKSDAKYFTKYHKDFRLNHQERTEISVQKCDILQKLSKSCPNEVNEEIVKYYLEILDSNQFSQKVNLKILESILQNQNTNFANENILKLLESNPDQIVPLIIQNARNIPKTLDSNILEKCCEMSFTFCDISTQFHNILYILCHNSDIKSSPYILEKILQDVPEENVTQYCDLLLLTGVKIFAKSPAETQHILGQIFEISIQNGLKEKVEFYSKVLKNHSDLYLEIISK